MDIHRQYSRRTFIKSTATLATGLALAPRSLWLASYDDLQVFARFNGESFHEMVVGHWWGSVIEGLYIQAHLDILRDGIYDAWAVSWRGLNQMNTFDGSAYVMAGDRLYVTLNLTVPK